MQFDVTFLCLFDPQRSTQFFLLRKKDFVTLLFDFFDENKDEDIPRGVKNYLQHCGFC